MAYEMPKPAPLPMPTASTALMASCGTSEKPSKTSPVRPKNARKKVQKRTEVSDHIKKSAPPPTSMSLLTPPPDSTSAWTWMSPSSASGASLLASMPSLPPNRMDAPSSTPPRASENM
jgi:hypothetical protein